MKDSGKPPSLVRFLALAFACAQAPPPSFSLDVELVVKIEKTSENAACSHPAHHCIGAPAIDTREQVAAAELRQVQMA